MTYRPQTQILRIQPRAKYLSLALIAAQRALSYRWTVFINMSTQFVWVIVSYFLWQAVFINQHDIDNFNWDRMKTYIVVSYAVNTLLYASSSVFRMMNLIHTGDIAVELIRPFNFFGAQLSQALGSLLIDGLLGGLISLSTGIFLGIHPPSSPLNASLFALSTILGFLIKFQIHFLVGLLCCWTLHWMGIYWAETAIVNLFSGSLLPLAFLPGWLGAIASILPFQAIVSTPLAIYFGDIQGYTLVKALGVQIFWILILGILIRQIWFFALRALEIQRG